MTVIDVLGQPCPIPVVKAKRAIAQLPDHGGVIRVLVDNAAACENLAKMAGGCGYSHMTEPRAGDTFAVTITVGEGRQESAGSPQIRPASHDGGLVVAIGTDSMGRGSEELGKVLIKGFIFSLTQLREPPFALLFFNSGVSLVTEGSNTLGDLKELAAKGASIWACGTCVDYYGLREKIAVGEITNMYGIVETMNAAGRLLNL
jgi:selenium metabolism protein YedF